MTQETLDEKFIRLSTQGTVHIDKYTHRFNFNRLLDLYGNWRRANDGPITTPRPIGFVGKETLKWDIWKSLDYKSPDECKSDYIALIRSMNKELLLSDPTLDFTN